jgi:formylglycine-generating enzyme required for sulfatase activity
LEAKPHSPEAEQLLSQAEEALHASTTLTLELARGVAIECIYVKPGTFMMGGDDDADVSWLGVEKPKHEVSITKGYYLGTTEVTRGQFAAFVEASGHVTEAERNGWSTGRRPDGTFGELPGASWRNPTVYTQDDDHPVSLVSWDDASAFCAWASVKTGQHVRLPTEAEWECACRAGTTTHFITGDTDAGLGAYCWFSGNASWQTHPVGTKQPNAWGFYDMHGNVFEWVEDWYDEHYYANGPAKDPLARVPRNGSRKICRGGGWHGGSRCCGSPVRRLEGRMYDEPDLGFRVAVTVGDSRSAPTKR